MKLDQSLLIAALQGYEAQLAKLEEQIAHVRRLASGGKTEVTDKPERNRKQRREVSAEGRKRMAEAQKRRWAAHRTRKK